MFGQRHVALALGASLLALTALAALPAAAGPGGAGHGHGDEYAFGQEGDPAKPSRVVEVEMLEANGKMLFKPDRIEVERGEQIRFVLRNSGDLEHEFVIGTVEENRKHAEMMLKFPEMEHDDPNSLHLEPGQEGELLWQFTQPGEFEFACLIAGHLEAGMHGDIVVR